MASLLITAALAVLSEIPGTHASPTNTTGVVSQRPSTSVAQCVEYMIPVEITSENQIFAYSPFKDNLDLINYVNDFVRKDSNVTFHPFSGAENVTATYTISGTFCSPKTPNANGREKTVLLATHGLAYDGRYWDSGYKPEEYSFVEFMIKEGYSVFFYDRIGTGKSQKISGFVAQAKMQVEIAAKLGSLIREGSYTGTIGKPDKLVLVGHSYGSSTSNGVIIKYPQLADAAVLTGTVFVPDFNQKLLLEAFGVRIASTVDPSRFSDLDTGYQIFSDIYGHYHTFFHSPGYELAALEYAQSIAAPLALVEYFTSPYDSPAAPEFSGAVLVTTGEFDLPACQGECYSSFAKQQLEPLFPKSGYRDQFVQPGAGHGINFATNATGFYDRIGVFLEKAGF